ncbi:thiamine pyrophosphate-dependent enzyme [Prochlorococcus sp. MIT 1306]|uniref:thiamine pyrophosphate-dependent enzyme n=1 Tax=Prochlorococcus sp. MIT 1306 TaxID=1799667 RepID=UPI0007B32EDB|nr:thiamine pyrophosphate-dependent enzyme [Prochlorococcus sp. MIT 1306]KZR61074.1 Acetoin:2,6-dichlorophenolindophenol oxidoreductase subunit alpha [Prochlorococcus sp. MIT 1306]
MVNRKTRLSKDFLNEYILCGKMRGLQEAISERYNLQLMRCPMHLSIGQEYWLPLVGKYSQKGDRFFSSHRSHSMYMALRGSVRAMIAELYGLEEGCTGGKGGSMHLKDLEVGLEASVPIVGSSIPLAVGSALSAKHSKKNILSVAYFGDGACEEGTLHECLNFCSVQKLPILFLCENNMYSCNTRIERRQPTKDMKRFAKAALIKSYEIRADNTYSKMNGILKECFSEAREKPIFLEINSYRLYEHCGNKKDESNGDRTISEYKEYEKYDLVSEMIRQFKEVKNAYTDRIEDVHRICNEMEGVI